MKRTAILLCLLTALPIAAQTRPHTTQTLPPTQAAGGRQPDVWVDIPNLSVEDIVLDVERVNVQVALDARVANLVMLNAGVQASINRVRLQISGVNAQAQLIVHLDKVAKILDRTLQTIDNNPKIITNLLQSVDQTVNTVGGIANNALQPGGVVSQAVGTVGQTLNNVTQPGGVLTQTVNTLGQTVQRTLDMTGNIVDKTLDTTGKVVNQTVAPVLNQTTNAAGQIVKQVRDASGQIIEYTFDQAGNIVSSKPVSRR